MSKVPSSQHLVGRESTASGFRILIAMIGTILFLGATHKIPQLLMYHVPLTHPLAHPEHPEAIQLALFLLLKLSPASLCCLSMAIDDLNKCVPHRNIGRVID